MLCRLAEWQKLHTSLYHLQTNRHYECFNHTLINMLGTLPPNKKYRWRDMIPMLVHVYNCTRSPAMGFSLYYLLYGWKPWLPVNLYFGTQRADMNATISTKFVQQLLERLKSGYKIAQHVIEKENKRHKWNYDHKVRCTQLGEGNLVLLERMAFKGKHKIKDHWEKTIYHVEGQPYVGSLISGTPVAGEGKVKIVH